MINWHDKRRNTANLSIDRLCKSYLRIVSIFCMTVLSTMSFTIDNAMASKSDVKADSQSITKGEDGLNVAVINIDYVVQNATATKTIQAAADEKRDMLQEQVESFEAMLRDEQAELKDLVNSKDPQAQAKKEAFENKLTDVRNKVSERSRILSEIFGTARNQVFEKAMAITKSLAKSRGYSLVLTSNVVVYEDGFDITNDVLSQLNQELPSVPLSFPSE